MGEEVVEMMLGAPGFYRRRAARQNLLPYQKNIMSPMSSAEPSSNGTVLSHARSI